MMPTEIPEEKVLRDIQRVADKLDKVPSRKEYAEHGQYSSITPRAKFGSWSQAREAAGLDGGPTRNTRVPTEEILNEIEDVAQEIGESPSQRQFNEYSCFSHQVVYERFGSWNDALEMCDLSTEKDERTPNRELLKDIESVAKNIGRVPSQNVYHEQGEYGLSVVKRRFDSWSKAVRKAGFDPYTVGPQTGEDNPAWRGGYEPYYGPNWYRQRKKARQRDGFECQSCGLTDEEHKEEVGCELEVHHIEPARNFEDFEEMNSVNNLITLCTSCHQTYESLPKKRAEELRDG